jgi:uncharacterized protein (TIRG00374 family)
MRTHLKTLAIAGLTLALLGLSLWGVDFARVWREIVSAELWALGLLLGCTALTYVLRALRWQYLLRPIGPTRFREAFRTTVIGFAANTVLPLRAGEMVRPYLLARREGLSVAATFTTIILERILDLVTVLVFFGAFVLFSDPGLDRVNGALYQTVKFGGLMGAAGSGAVLLVLALNAVRPTLTHTIVDLCLRVLPGGLRSKVSSLIYGLLDGLAVTRDPLRLAQAIALSFPLWLSIAGGIWMAMVAFHMTIPFTGSFLIMTLLVVGVAAPTPGAVGGFHAAFRYGATVFYGVENDRAVGAALVLHAASFVPVTLLGALFMFQDGLNLSGMRQMGTEAKAQDAPKAQAAPTGSEPA